LAIPGKPRQIFHWPRYFSMGDSNVKKLVATRAHPLDD
jgi:hypothetical protein